MPALSKKQQKFFGIVRAIQKGEQVPTTPETAKAAADMKKGDVKKFASTKHKGLPEKKVAKEEYGNPKVGPALKMARLIDKTKPGPKSKRTKISQYLKRREMDGDKKKFAAMGEENNPRIPRKKGQPANSKKHSDLYTDENPKGTIHGLGFKDVSTAKASVTKIRNSSRSHAHKIQAAVAMEQRAREMGKTSEAAVYRKFINSMKKKTKKMNEAANPAQQAAIAINMKKKGKKPKDMNEGSLHKWFKGSKSKDGKGGWVNVVTGGTCASDEPGEGTPKCVSSAKRASMTKAERLSAARRKKKADPGQQQKTGAAKPTYVSTDSPRKKKMKESYGGKGVSRKAKLASTHPPTAQAAIKNIPTETDRGSGNKAKRRAGMPVEKKSPTYKAYAMNKEETQLNEVKDRKGKGSGKKDACYHKVKSRYSVWPSAYASGALVKCRKVGAANWGNKSEEFEPTGISFQQFQEKAKKCWPGYEKKGTKMMFGKRYNNCVKKEEVEVVNEVSDKLKKSYIKGATKDIEKLRKTGRTPSGELDTPSADRVIKRKINIGKTMATMKKEAVENEYVNSFKKQGGYLNSPARKKADAEYAKNNPKRKPFEKRKIGTLAGNKLNDEVQYEVEVLDERQKDSDNQRLSQERGRSNYGKATIRNKRKFGTSGELPDPITGKKITKDATRGELISKRREEHRARRGVKTKGMKEEVTGWRKDIGYEGKDDSKKLLEDDMKGMSVKSGHKRPTKSGAGMTQKGVEAYRRRNPGSKLQTAVTTKPSKLKKGSKAANRRKSYCARSAGQMKKFPKAAKDPNSRLRQARRRWNC